MQQKAIFLIFFLTIGVFETQNLFAQQRFKAGLVVGLNAAQIMGDKTGGYNKLGVVGGLKGIAILTDKAELSMELTYSQRGSKNDESEPVNVKIKLEYVEVPILFSYKDWYNEEGDFYRLQGSIGFSYGRLLNAEFDDLISSPIDVTDRFITNDFSFVIGADVFFTPHWALGARWNSSFNKLAKNVNSPTGNGLRGYFFTFRATYVF